MSCSCTTCMCRGFAEHQCLDRHHPSCPINRGLGMSPRVRPRPPVRRRPPLGVVTVTGRGSGLLRVLYWLTIAGIGVVAWKAGKYALTGRRAPRPGLPPAWRAHG